MFFDKKDDAAEIAKRLSRAKSMLILGWVALSSAVIMTIGAGGTYLYMRNFVAKAQHTEGRVVELTEHKENNETKYTVVYSYSDAAGVMHKNSTASGGPDKYKIGDPVEVLFDPARPQKSKINSYLNLWVLPTILSIIGGMDWILGPIFLYLAKRFRSAAPPSNVKAIKEC